MLKMKRERLSRTHWRALLLQQLGDRGVIKDQKKKKTKPQNLEKQTKSGVTECCREIR